MKLSKRLSTIAAQVLPHSSLVDVGTDHAYVPIFLVQNKLIARAIAGDIHEGPYRAAQQAIAALSLQQEISLRLGDGLSIISPGEADTAVIAGMGGSAIMDILSHQRPVADSLRRLILQPMAGAGLLRRWLVEQGWRLCHEELVREDGRLYEIIVAEPGQSEPVEPVLWDIGPVLWRQRHWLLAEHIRQLVTQAQRVLANMNQSPQARQSGKYHEYAAHARELEEKLTCL